MVAASLRHSGFASLQQAPPGSASEPFPALLDSRARPGYNRYNGILKTVAIEGFDLRVIGLLTVLLLGLGLALQGAHGIALCVDRDWDVTVEAAVDGACVGSRSSACCDADDDKGPAGHESHSCDRCGGCRDVLLSDGDIDTPLPTDHDARRLVSLAACTLASTHDMLDSDVISTEGSSTALPTITPSPPPGGTAVLLL